MRNLPFYDDGNFKDTETIGGFRNVNTANEFDSAFESVHDTLMANTAGYDVKMDIGGMIKDPNALTTYKESLLEQLSNDTANYDSATEDPHFSNIYEQVSALWDNQVDQYMKEYAVGNLLPMSSLELPILVKQHVKAAAREIMQTEVTRTPVIKKHFEQKWMVDNQSKKRWKYPNCFFTDEFDEIYKAGKGLEISSEPVELPLFEFDIITELTDGGNPKRDRITPALKITKVIDSAGNEINVDMRISMADGMWLGGNINETVNGKEVKDLIVGSTNFTDNTITLASCNGEIKKVVFEGYLSNELNERTVTMDYTREEFEWTIADGFRMNSSFSIEQLTDSKALLNLDMYQKTYNDMSDFLVQIEDSEVLKFLDKEFEKYKGVEVDPLSLKPFIRERTFDCDHTEVSGILKSDYIDQMLKFLIDRFVIDICDDAKMEDMTFVMYGNPRYISLLGKNVNWVVKSGDSMGGIKLNYSYGVMNSGNVRIHVVSASKFDAKKELHQKLRIIPYPMNNEQMTFRYYKYTTHMLTQKNSMYMDYDKPGGTATNLTGTVRALPVSLQGIQGTIGFEHIDFIEAK